MEWNNIKHHPSNIIHLIHISHLPSAISHLNDIHQNHLKAGIVKKVGDYEWSSWSEYTGKVPAAVCLCAINAVYKRITTEDLKELVDTPLDEEVSCLDIDEVVRVSIGDRDVR